jgi:hypothetical protein
MTDQSIGYKKPPAAHRFTPGRSGNPSGKPKGTRSLKSDLRDELSELVPFREGDREVEISKQRVVIKQLVASAIAGNTRAIATLVAMCVRAFGDGGGDDDTDTAVDRDIVETFGRCRAKRGVKKSTSNNSSEQE